VDRARSLVGGSPIAHTAICLSSLSNTQAEAANVVSTLASAAEGYPFVPPAWAPSVFVPLTGLVIPAVAMASLFVYIEVCTNEDPYGALWVMHACMRVLGWLSAVHGQIRHGMFSPCACKDSARTMGAAPEPDSGSLGGDYLWAPMWAAFFGINKLTCRTSTSQRPI